MDLKEKFIKIKELIFSNSKRSLLLLSSFLEKIAAGAALACFFPKVMGVSALIYSALLSFFCLFASLLLANGADKGDD